MGEDLARLGTGAALASLALSPIHALSTSFPACSLSLSTVAQGVAAYSDHIIKENSMLKTRYIHNAAGGRLKQRHIFVAVWYFFPHTTTDSDASGVVPACLPACQYSTSRERVHSVDEKEMKGAGRPWEGPSVGGGCCVQWAIFL